MKMDRTANQEYIRWKYDLISGFFQLNHLSMARHGLVMELFYPDSGRFIRLRSEEPLVSRVIDRDRRGRQFGHQDLAQGVYIVLRSDLIEELLSETLGHLADVDLLHYLIVTSDACVDIVTLKSAELELLLP